MSFLGVILTCASVEASSCSLVASPYVFEDLARCAAEAEEVNQQFLDLGFTSQAFCVELLDEPKGELL